MQNFCRYFQFLDKTDGSGINKNELYNFCNLGVIGKNCPVEKKLPGAAYSVHGNLILPFTT